MSDEAAARRIVDVARAAGRSTLFEHEGYVLLGQCGVACPQHRFLADPAGLTADDLAEIPGDRVVLKVAATRLAHKSDVGGVCVLSKDVAIVGREAAAMIERLAAYEPAGVLVAETVPYEPGLATEWLASVRLLPEFGPVVTLAPGGLHAEVLGASLAGDCALGAALLTGSDVDCRAAFGAVLTSRLATEWHRGAAPEVTWPALETALRAFAELGRRMAELGVIECEVNPLVASRGRLVALDALVSLGEIAPPAPPRPAGKLRQLLLPGTIAIVGVSDRENPGRVILGNLLGLGFPSDRITVVKPGRPSVDGCRAVADLSALPAPVDLLVLAVPAERVPALLAETIDRRAAGAVLVIPGGFEETARGAALGRQIRADLARSRAMPGGGPVVLGANCLGFRSRDARVDALFIPERKVARAGGRAVPLALVAQSGAFALTRVGRWPALDPKYIVTLGNQTDVTAGDVIEYLERDPDVRVVALYIEGFSPGDGARVLEAASRLTAAGRSVVLYRAGRTPAGRSATASHTASIAGDYRVTAALARQAGVLLAESLDEFDDLVRLAVALDGRPVGAGRLGVVSNAGFECVAAADATGGLALPPFLPETAARLAGLFAAGALERLVDIHNPLDLTPVAGDEVFEAAVRAVLDDEGVEVGLVGCVPMTPALQTLPAGTGEDLTDGDSIGPRLVRLARGGDKPMVVVVDGGAAYDPLARFLDDQGLAVFRSIDRAGRALARYVSSAARSQRSSTQTAQSV